MTTKEYLYQLKDIDNLINTYQEEIDRLMTMATSTTQHIKDINVMTSKQNRTEDLIVKITELRDKTNHLIDVYIDLKLSARRVIEQIRPLSHQVVLMKYYFQNKTFEQTAVEMGKSYQWVCELHGRALQDFENIEKNMDS